MPAAPVPAGYLSIVTVTESSEIPLKSPFPPLHHKLALKISPTLRRAVAQKDKIIEGELRKSWERFSFDSESDQELRCALDLIMQREVEMANKEQRMPE